VGEKASQLWMVWSRNSSSEDKEGKQVVVRGGPRAHAHGMLTPWRKRTTWMVTYRFDGEKVSWARGKR
jgi:hypothetical protein